MSKLSNDDIRLAMGKTMYGDMLSDGPIKRPNNRSISIVFEHKTWHDFINHSFSLKNETIENMVNALNHFIDYMSSNGGYNYQSIIIYGGLELENDINDMLFNTIDVTSNDVNSITKISCNVLEKYLLDKKFVLNVLNYIERFSCQNVEFTNKYASSLDNTSIKILCVLSVIIKCSYFILAKSITKNIGKLNTSNLLNVVGANFFGKAYRTVSKVYSDLHNLETVYDFEENVLCHFIDKSEKVIDNQAEHIRTKHAMFGTTPSSIYESLYLEIISLLRKIRIYINYKDSKGDNDEGVILDVLRVNSFTSTDIQTMDDKTIPYLNYPEIDMFGYAYVRIIKYLESSLRKHMGFQCKQKKESAIAIELRDDGDDDNLSAYERKMRDKDVIDKEKYLQCIENKEAYLDEISISIPEETIKEKIINMSELAVTKNSLNSMLMTIRLDYDGIIVGNPIEFLSANDLYRFLAVISCWSVLDGYPSLKKCLVSKKSDIQCDMDTGYIYNRVMEVFGDHKYKIKLYKSFLESAGYLYTHMDKLGNKYSVTLNVDDLINFCKEMIDNGSI